MHVKTLTIAAVLAVTLGAGHRPRNSAAHRRAPCPDCQEKR